MGSGCHQGLKGNFEELQKLGFSIDPMSLVENGKGQIGHFI